MRFTVNSAAAVANIPYFLEHTPLPLVADIHFDYKLAIDAAEAGISKIRINPGNIGDDDRVRRRPHLRAAGRAGARGRQRRVAGKTDRRKKYGAPTAEALAESALENIRRLSASGPTSWSCRSNPLT